MMSPLASHAPWDRSLLAYSTGGVASGLASAVPSVLLLFFCTQVLKINAFAATVILFMPKAMAIVADPWIGSMLDRISRQPRGIFWMMGAGVILIVAGFLLVFNPPENSATPVFFWMLGSYALLSLGYSLYVIAHVALAPMVAQGNDLRALWVTVRMMLVFVGILLGASIAPMIIGQAESARSGHSMMAAWLAVICAASTVGTLSLAWKKNLLSRPLLPRRGIRGVGLKTPGLLRLCAAYLLLLIAVGIVSASTPYLVTDIAGRGLGDVGVVMGVYLISAIASAPLWMFAGRRFGERLTLRWALAIYALSPLLIVSAILLRADWNWIIATYCIGGISFFALQALPYSLASQIAARGAAAGDIGEGAATGIWTATEKLGLASGPVVTGLLLAQQGGASTGFAWAASSCSAALAIAAAATLGRVGSVR